VYAVAWYLSVTVLSKDLNGLSRFLAIFSLSLILYYVVRDFGYVQKSSETLSHA